MAVINSRPLTIEHLNDPTGVEPLTPNHILMIKPRIVFPPPGEFVKQDLYLRKKMCRCSFCQMSFGLGGGKNISLIFSRDKSGKQIREIQRSMT